MPVRGYDLSARPRHSLHLVEGRGQQQCWKTGSLCSGRGTAPLLHVFLKKHRGKEAEVNAEKWALLERLHSLLINQANTTMPYNTTTQTYLCSFRPVAQSLPKCFHVNFCSSENSGITENSFFFEGWQG